MVDGKQELQLNNRNQITLCGGFVELKLHECHSMTLASYHRVSDAFKMCLNIDILGDCLGKYTFLSIVHSFHNFLTIKQAPKLLMVSSP